MQTLEDWIDTNEFGLASDVKVEELKKVLLAYDDIIQLVEEKKSLEFKDVIPYIDTSKKMQDAYLAKYETEPKPKFPLYKENMPFVGKWNC